jgi:23S rRNA maturation mini-RNase III
MPEEAFKSTTTTTNKEQKHRILCLCLCMVYGCCPSLLSLFFSRSFSLSLSFNTILYCHLSNQTKQKQRHNPTNTQKAEYQSMLLQCMKQQSFPFTDIEIQVLNRGRNSVTKRSTSNKNRGKHTNQSNTGANTCTNPSTYQDSTAFEALIGYLYITNPQRCYDVLLWLEPILKSNNNTSTTTMY